MSLVRSIFTRLGAALIAAVALAACDRDKSYDQSTPRETLRAGVEMVKQGDAEQLARLIYADSPDMRATLDQLGLLLGEMQDLVKSLEARFPDEIAELKLKARAEAEKLDSATFLESLVPSGPPKPTRVEVSLDSKGNLTTRDSADARADERDEIRGAINGLFANPFAWIENHGEKLDAEQVTDDLATITYNGQPLFGGVSLSMKLEGGKWYIVLPTNMPPLREGMPKTQAQWAIIRSLVRVLDRTVKDMRADVDAGRVESLDRLARSAQEKVLFPGIMVVGAYAREMEVAERIDRRNKQFQDRLKAWSKKREEQAGAAVSPKLVKALSTMAPRKIEEPVRANERVRYAEMSDIEFEGVMQEWLKEDGLAIRLDGDIDARTVDPPLDAWEKRKRTPQTAAR